MLSAFCMGPRAFELREIDTPHPSTGEVLIRVRSCGVCGSDLHYYTGGFPAPSVCPGHEISGEVTDVGTGVTGLSGGDRVAVEPLVVCRECAYCRTGDYQLCRRIRILGTMLDGGFAELLRLPAYALFSLPKAVDFEVGALTEPLAVCIHAVRLANVRMGDRVLVQGAGTIGLLAIVAARAAGATDIWITARHPHQAAAATALGATRVFQDADAAAALANAAEEQPIDVIIETVGGHADTLAEAIQLVRRGGSIAVLGIFTTFPSINAIALVLKEVRMVGSLTYGRTAARADFDIALHLLAAQPERFRALITHRFPLTEIAHGFETAADKHTGAIKVAIRPA